MCLPLCYLGVANTRISLLREAAAFQWWTSAERAKWWRQLHEFGVRMFQIINTSIRIKFLSVWAEKWESVLQAVPYCWQPGWLHMEREVIELNWNVNREARRSFKSASRAHLSLVIMFTFQISIFVFLPSLSFPFICSLMLSVLEFRCDFQKYVLAEQGAGMACALQVM